MPSSKKVETKGMGIVIAGRARREQSKPGEGHGLEMAMEMTSYEYVVHLLAIWYEPNAKTTTHTSTTTSTSSVFLMCAIASRVFVMSCTTLGTAFHSPLCIPRKMGIKLHELGICDSGTIRSCCSYRYLYHCTNPSGWKPQS